ncbi:MAG: hypothetical protein JRJ44_05060 [Deltaproteobacteria bacterium]|nr:hypothetical protein [Deltaproteobacteria bacterium]
MVQPKNGTYYLGRIIKAGRLNHEKLIQAILNPIPITFRNFAWSFINIQQKNINNIHFIYAKSCKYSPDTKVMVIDPEKGEELSQEEPNLSIASSPFVYIPEFSGIAFLRIPENIEPKTFMARFAALVKNKYDNFFINCKIEPIAGLRTFAMKLANLENILKISASISPPNPLFNPLWESSKKYLETRGINRMKIEEESAQDKNISTNLPLLVKKVAEQTPNNPIIEQKYPIGDAAILMAADGYGNGYVVGRQKEKTITIKTSETMKNFSFLKKAKPEALGDKAYKILKKIKEDRHMKHSEK